MKNLFKYVQNYLIFSLPFVLLTMGWSSYRSAVDIQGASPMIRMVWEILSWNLMLWFGILISFLVALVVYPGLRDQTLKRIANIRERDEFEEHISARASRTAYISTLSFIILLLFLSIFNINVSRVPEAQAVNGKRGIVEIGFNFSLFDKPKIDRSGPSEVYFESTDIPLSKSGLLMGLLLWQLCVFNLSATRQRKAYQVED